MLQANHTIKLNWPSIRENVRPRHVCLVKFVQLLVTEVKQDIDRCLDVLILWSHLMKKSLIALAVLAASGAAMAQSSVTLYGVADIFYANVKNTGVATQNVLNSGSVNGSRWGLKGSEDLGGGLNAIFKLESGFNIDSGSSAQGGLLFGRYAYVGFNGGFGEVRLGRIATAFDDVNGAANAVFDANFAPANNVFKSTKYTVRTDNTIYYQSPSFSGFSGAVSYALGENKTATVEAGSIASMNVAYGNGPLAVSAAYQTEKATGAAVALQYARLNAAYTFAPVTLKASYGKAGNVGSVSGADASEWQLGADYAVSAPLLLTASVARSADNAAAGDFVRTGYGIGAKYVLSKRTFVYGGYESDKTAKEAVADVTHSMLVAGVQHRF